MNIKSTLSIFAILSLTIFTGCSGGNDFTTEDAEMMGGDGDGTETGGNVGDGDGDGDTGETGGDGGDGGDGDVVSSGGTDPGTGGTDGTGGDPSTGGTSACVPSTCEELNGCGEVLDGCGNLINCGGCTAFGSECIQGECRGACEYNTDSNHSCEEAFPDDNQRFWNYMSCEDETLEEIPLAINNCQLLAADLATHWCCNSSKPLN